MNKNILHQLLFSVISSNTTEIIQRVKTNYTWFISYL